MTTYGAAPRDDADANDATRRRTRRPTATLTWMAMIGATTALVAVAATRMRTMGALTLGQAPVDPAREARELWEAREARHASTKRIVDVLRKNVAAREARAALGGGVLSLLADSVSIAGSVATSVGDLASGGGDFCWKTTTTRGAGEVGYECDHYKDEYGQPYVAIGILCYPPCKPGYEHSSIYDCKQKCADVDSNYKDHPTSNMYCERKSEKTKTRSSRSATCTSAALGEEHSERVGGSRKLLGSSCSCPSGYYLSGTTCFSNNCPSGYESKFLSNECRANCNGFKDNDIFDGVCAKAWYSRVGQEKITGCADGTSTDGGWGLCYPSCPNGKTGVGPVCWQESLTVNGQKWFDCGMGFATDEVTCALTTTDMVLGPLDVVICLASGLSACVASSGADAAMSTAELVVDNVGKIADVVCDVADAATLHRDLESGSYDDPEDALRLAMEVADVFDPTGISGCIAAYTWPICDETTLEEVIEEAPKCSHDHANAALEPGDGQDYLCYDPFVRYIRIDRSNGKQNLCLNEIIVKEKLKPGNLDAKYDADWLDSMPNIATGATVVSGSSRPAFPLMNVVDGSTQTTACTKKNNNWIQIDLGTPKPVYSVELVGKPSSPWTLKGSKITFFNERYEVLKFHALDDEGHRIHEYDADGNPTGTVKIAAKTNLQFADDSETITVVYDPIVYSNHTVDDDTKWFYMGCAPLTPYFCPGGTYTKHTGGAARA